MVKHYETQGPRLAKELAKQSEKYPLVRKLLVSGKEGIGIAGLLTAVLAYLYGPAIVTGMLPPVPIAGTILGVELPAPPDDPGPPNGTPPSADPLD